MMSINFKRVQLIIRQPYWAMAIGDQRSFSSRERELLIVDEQYHDGNWRRLWET